MLNVGAIVVGVVAVAKLSSSWLVKLLVELRLALSLIITTHPHPHPPRKVEEQLESGHIWSVGSPWIVCLLIFGSGGSLEWHCIEETHPTGQVYHNSKLT